MSVCYIELCCYELQPSTTTLCLSGNEGRVSHECVIVALYVKTVNKGHIDRLNISDFVNLCQLLDLFVP